MKHSELTVESLIRNLPYIKITYNNKVIYDENTENYDHVFMLNTLARYMNKKVCSMQVNVTEFHHCEIIIEGEK